MTYLTARYHLRHLFLLLILPWMTACGNKGDLVLPTNVAPVPTETQLIEDSENDDESKQQPRTDNARDQIR